MLDGSLPRFLNPMLTAIEPNGFVKEYKTPHADLSLANVKDNTILKQVH
jgi:hypothetical protein